jgi:hypothetical protein
LQNAYGNSRNNIATTQNENLANLEQTYNTNLANAKQQYNQSLSQAEENRMAYLAQLESDLASSVTGSYSNLYNALGSLDSNYTNAMADVLKQQAAYQLKASQATNSDGSGTNVENGTVDANSKTYLAALARAQSLQQLGADATKIINNLSATGANSDQIADILNQLGF